MDSLRLAVVDAPAEFDQQARELKVVRIAHERTAAFTRRQTRKCGICIVGLRTYGWICLGDSGGHSPRNTDEGEEPPGRFDLTMELDSGRVRSDQAELSLPPQRLQLLEQLACSGAAGLNLEGLHLKVWGGMEYHPLRHRNAVYDKMVELMATDKAKNHILPISSLGIMQMTRQRQQESLSSNLYTDCPYCRGRGIVKSATTMSVELQRKLSSVVRRLQLRNDGKEYSLRVLVHPSILERLRSEDADLLVRMEKLFGVKLAFRADLNYHVENFKIINAITGEEYR